MITHNNWEKLFGNVQRCDGCEESSIDGVLYRCKHKPCSMYICQQCARFNRLGGPSGMHLVSHFLDADRVSWDNTSVSGKVNPPNHHGTARSPTIPTIPAPLDNAGPSTDPSPAIVAASVPSSAPALALAAPQIPHHLSHNRMREVMKLHGELYPHSQRKSLPGPLVQFTIIPESWEGTVRHSNVVPRQIGIHEQYHQQANEATLQFLDRGILPTPPPGYKEWAFRTHPLRSKSQYPAFSETAREAPAWHAHNELSPEELFALHNDRDLQTQMSRAWRKLKDDLSHLHGRRKAAAEEDALQLLWEVFELRKAWSGPLKASQTVRWFVRERDLLRL